MDEEKFQQFLNNAREESKAALLKYKIAYLDLIDRRANYGNHLPTEEELKWRREYKRVLSQCSQLERSLGW